MKKWILAAALTLCAATAFADEGMWMINTIDRVLEKRMKAAGLKIDAKVLYDEEHESLSDAVVALAFGCTGGQHRSVVLANEIARIFREEGRRVTLEHRALK